MLRDAEKLARIGSFEWDIRNDQVTWSEGLYAIYGLTPDEFEASFDGFLAQVHPEDREMVQATIHKAYRDGRPFSIEERIVRRDGTVRTLRSRGEVVTDADGVVVSLLGVCQDVTEAKQAEAVTAAWNQTLEERVRERTRQLQETNAKLEAALEQLELMQDQVVTQAKMAAVGSLVAGIAHEFNTPLGALKGAVDVVKRCVPRITDAVDKTPGVAGRGHLELRRELEALQENSRVATVAGNRLSEIVERLEVFTKMDESPVARLDLHDALESSLTMIRQDASRVRITKNYGELPRIWCDSSQLHHVFMNLLLNACDAIEGTGEIRIETWADGDSVFARIRDNGKGIAPEKLKGLFDIGFVTRGANVRLKTGLFNANNIVQSHGGDITADSELGGGASFTVRLPIRGTEIVGRKPPELAEGKR